MTRFARYSACAFLLIASGAEAQILYRVNGEFRLVSPDGMYGLALPAAHEAKWLPDGHRILLSRPGPEATNLISILEVESWSLTDIASGRYPDLSPDGTKVICVRGSNIVVIDVGSSQLGPERVVDLGEAWRRSLWVPDGRRVLLQVTRGFLSDLFVVNADGTDRQELRSAGGLTPSSGYPFSPDGREFLFTTGGDGDFQLRVFNIDTGRERLIGLRGTDGVWSHDGSRLAYVTGAPVWGNTPALKVINSNGGGERVLVSGSPSLEPRYPTWSRDESQIAFSSAPNDVVGASWIYVLNVLRGDLVKLTPGIQPMWAPPRSEVVDGDGSAVAGSSWGMVKSRQRASH